MKMRQTNRQRYMNRQTRNRKTDKKQQRYKVRTTSRQIQRIRKINEPGNNRTESKKCSKIIVINNNGKREKERRQIEREKESKKIDRKKERNRERFYQVARKLQSCRTLKTEI